MPNPKSISSSPLTVHDGTENGVADEELNPGRNGVVPAGAIYAPDPHFISRALGRPVAAVRAVPVKKSGVPAMVYRLAVQFQDGTHNTYVLKRIAPGWPGDPQGYRREARFYHELFPRLDLPPLTVHYAGPEPAGNHQVVLLDDFQHTHYCPPGTYRWQPADMARAIPVYARLHVSGRENLPPPAGRDWLFPRMETRIIEQADALPGMVAAINAAGKWPPLPRFPQLLAWLLAHLPAMQALPPTILHMDVYPPNVALPRNGQDSTILIDWDMVSFGPAELDLAFMFMQPYRAHEDLDREQVLAHYWRERAQLEGHIPTPAERRLRQLCADVLWAVWQIPTAYQLLTRPFAPDSGPGRYWVSMYAVLGERLFAYTEKNLAMAGSTNKVG